MLVNWRILFDRPRYIANRHVQANPVRHPLGHFNLIEIPRRVVINR